MASCSSHSCCLYLRGNLQWRESPDSCSSTSVAGPFEPVGELSAFGYTPQITKIGGNKSLSLEGGLQCSTTTFDSLDISMTVRCASNSNLAVAMFGDSGEITGGTITGETIASEEVAVGAYLPLEKVGATNVVITSHPSAVAGVDYKVTPAGIEVLTDELVDGVDVVVNYKYDIQSRVEIGTRNAVERELLFNGKDQDGNAVVFRLYRVSIAADGKVDWLNDNDFISFTISGTALSDDSRPSTEFAPGLPVSTFGYIQRAV